MNAIAGGRSTIAVKVSFMGELVVVTGLRNLQVTLPKESTVADLLQSLSKGYGDDFASRVFSGPAKLRHTMLIFVDGENINQIGGLAAKLANSEVDVILLPTFDGG